MQSHRQILLFWGKTIFPSSALKMETTCFSEMAVSGYKATWYHSPEYQKLNTHCHKNLKIYTHGQTTPNCDFISHISTKGLILDY
jgi:hypothetical protein